MEESIHGHEVMEMMVASGESYTKKSLEDAIVEQFGPDARFHTCSVKNMTAQELISFFESRNKFVSRDAGFTANPDKICDH